MDNTETIRELTELVVPLEERLDNSRAEIRRLDGERSKSEDLLLQIDLRLAVFEDNVRELKKVADERDRRRWTIVLALIGCILSVIANIGLTFFKAQR